MSIQPVASPAGCGTSGADRRPVVRHLHPGQSLLFGACGCQHCAFDLVVPVAPGGAGIGRITAYPDHWRLDNPGTVPLAVENLERPTDLITAPGGRSGVAVPFELARVSAGQLRLVTVFGPEPAGPPAPARPCPAAGDRGVDRLLDPHAIYYAVLVALCEPRLLQSADAALPTSAEIAQRLAHRGIAISPRAVDWHIEYLIDKLGLRAGGQTGRAKRSWRKEAVVAAAQRLLLISPEHLLASAGRAHYPQSRQPVPAAHRR